MAEARMLVLPEFNEQQIDSLPWPEGTKCQYKGRSEVGNLLEFMVSHPDIPDNCDEVAPSFRLTGSDICFGAWNPVVVSKVKISIPLRDSPCR